MQPGATKSPQLWYGEFPVFWDVMLCQWTNGPWWFAGLCYLHLWGTSWTAWPLKKKTLDSFKMLQNHATTHNIPEDQNPQLCCHKNLKSCTVQNRTFIGSCSANILAEYNQQDATFHNLFISVGRSTCFRRFFRPSSGCSLARLAAGSSNGLTITG